MERPSTMDTLQIAKEFLKNNKLASLATLAHDSGRPQLSVVYYILEDNYIFFITDKGSRKALNVIKNKKIALLIVYERFSEMLQIEGTCEIIDNSDIRLRKSMQIFDKINSADTSEPWPVLKLHPIDLEVFKIEVEWFKYSKFGEDTALLEGSKNDWFGLSTSKI